MALSDKLFQYCERGLDPAFHAEPLNAYSNIAFLIAGAALLAFASRKPAPLRKWTDWLIAGLVVAIGVGSFLFHTFATAWAAAADVIPITIFIVIYLAIALNRFLELPVLWTVVLTSAFAVLSQTVGSLACSDATMPIGVGGSGGVWCMNGSIGFVPAFLAMCGVGATLHVRGHPAALALIGAAGLFALSLTLRTIDGPLCEWLIMGGVTIGSHFGWHILNATVLFVLGKAAIQFGEVTAAPKGE